MRKRLAFLLVLLIVFLLSGCSTIPLEKKELEEYKNIAIQELNIYLETKLTNNFYDDVGHNNLVSIVKNGIVKITKCREKTAIDLIKSEAQRDMDFVEPMESVGQFFSLQEAYNNKILTVNEIKKIAACNFEVEELESKIQYAIKKLYLESLKDSDYPNKKIEDISILHYYGQYGNCYVVQIIDAYADFPAVELECVVAGIVVKYSGPPIIVWERPDFNY
ncbi:MAG: hypothetical protein DBY28_02135 [Subdoligranulum sp.]|nr:MAG: hypothetical protein DBY28_02135 [Subdoligranulum sp.]